MCGILKSLKQSKKYSTPWVASPVAAETAHRQRKVALGRGLSHSVLLCISVVRGRRDANLRAKYPNSNVTKVP
ncbi:hypothetical protein O181_062770 [Austropuccinia psidii MF-1]|uniref:Uncharacterized protein n=1 Tax=Austropuccinia psidii MF-1 TaxID=1389203 RepID=A0A9Q3EPY9_9BASI|nr:hypothetical protein [Austropuccinia psidii MF-1]